MLYVELNEMNLISFFRALVFLLQGYDNLALSIPELELASQANPSTTITHQSLQRNRFVPGTDSIQLNKDMSPLPMHNRSIVGQRMACGIDTIIFLGGELYER